MKAVIFDFGQTLVDSADGFRSAEREAQEKILATLPGIERERFLEVYRRVRKSHHEQSRLSRLEIWRTVCRELARDIDERRLIEWEGEYWRRVNALTRVFPEAQTTLETLVAIGSRTISSVMDSCGIGSAASGWSAPTSRAWSTPPTADKASADTFSDGVSHGPRSGSPTAIRISPSTSR